MIHRHRAFSESHSSSIKVSQRHYSFDQTVSHRPISRFGFVYNTPQDEEEPIQLLNLYEDFMINSPLQDISDIPQGKPYSDKLQELLSPSSPYKWMPDVVKLPLQTYADTTPQSPLLF